MASETVTGDRLRSRFGPVPRHPVLDRIGTVIDTVVAPQATVTDAGAVPASHLAALAAAGLFRLAVPPTHGGETVPDEVTDEAFESLAGACPSTHLIASQHATPVGWIIRSGRPELLALLPGLAGGQLYGGAAFGHVRTWPRRRTVTATRVPGGWRFDGIAPWFSGDGLVHLVAVGAIDERDRQVVLAVVDLPQPTAVRSLPLDLAAIAGARTCALEFSGLFVPDSRVTEIVDFGTWSAQDGRKGPRVYPGAVGLARTALRSALRRYPDDPSLHLLADEVATLRAVSAGRSEAGGDPLWWKARSVNLAVRATNAAVVARGGAALRTDDIVQVWARAALFLQVRGLSDELRAAHLARLSQPVGH